MTNIMEMNERRYCTVNLRYNVTDRTMRNYVISVFMSRFPIKRNFGVNMGYRFIAITVNYRYNVIDGTLKKLRYIRFYVIPV